MDRFLQCTGTLLIFLSCLIIDRRILQQFLYVLWRCCLSGQITVLPSVGLALCMYLM